MCAFVWIAYIRGDYESLDWCFVWGSKKDAIDEMDEKGYLKMAEEDESDSILYSSYSGEYETSTTFFQLHLQDSTTIWRKVAESQVWEFEITLYKPSVEEPEFDSSTEPLSNRYLKF